MGKGLSIKEKRFFFSNFFLVFFVGVLLITKPRGGGLKSLLDCPLKMIFFRLP